MSVSSAEQARLTVPPAIGWVVAMGGAAAIFATYWDEAWHTDVGRDSAWGAPHVLLYGSVAVVGLAISCWGLNAWTSTGSLRAALGSKSLLLTGAAGLTVLAAAPIDAAWHNAFGRDAVGWSPPHMLVIFGGITLIIGVLSGLATTAKVLRAVTGVLLLADAVAVVFEYEADVPQFTEQLYLPILLLAAILAATIVRDSVPLPAPVTTVVVGYAGLRLAIGLGLAALGRSTPDLPIAILGLAALDLPLRSGFQRATAAAMATAVLAWAASASGLASPAPGDVATTAVPVLALGLVVLVASKVRIAGPAALAAVVVGGALVSVSVTAPARPAYAHDPGQGEVVTHVEITGTSDARGLITLTVDVGDHCDDLTPVRVVARRAGQSRTGMLRATGPCTFTGSVDVAPAGRWFSYAEFRHQARVVEGWLPLRADQSQRLNEERALYLPAGEGDSTTVSQVLAGGLTYTVGVGLLGAGILVNRRVRVRPLASPTSGRVSKPRGQ